MAFPPYTPTGFAATVFWDRYAIHERETFEQACQRVAAFIAQVEQGTEREDYAARFHNLLATNRFSPGGRVWRGAGRPRGQCLNCFTWTDDLDSREGWGDALRAVTIISGTGGGVGLNFSKVRPRGSPIRGTGGVATGSVSLMRCINAVCNELREGGGRRSALMFCLRYDHPDLPEFLEVKLNRGQLENANISVLIDDEFLKLVDEDGEIVLRWHGEERGRVRAKEVWDKIVRHAWATGDPGLLNLGLAERMNTLYYRVRLVCPNPCSEIWMSPYDCCCLGAVVLPTHVRNGGIDWNALKETVSLAVRFLDDVLDRNHYPLAIIEETCREYRRIGLGVTGLHDLLLKLGVRYDSDQALKITAEVMDFIKRAAYESSIRLAIEKGPFPAVDREKHARSGFATECLPPSIRRRIEEHGIRNCAVLTVAPTGTTSIVAACSSGIEPIFAPVYRQRFAEHGGHGQESSEIVVHPLLAKFLREGRSIEHFQGAHEIGPEQHCAVQEVCQKHIDNAISKTINLPTDYPVEQLSQTMRRFIPRLKGLTIYRHGSRGESPMTPLPIAEAAKHLANLTIGAAVGDCPAGACEL